MKKIKKFSLMLFAVIASISAIAFTSGVKDVPPDEDMICLHGNTKVCVLEDGKEKCLTPVESNDKDCAGMIGVGE